MPTHSLSKTASVTKNTEVRNSIKNGGKRRANSNTTTAEKKVNLDKFLSAVQQRSNFTPAAASQANGRLAAPKVITNLYKPNDEKKPQQSSYNSSNLTLN